MHGAPSSCLNPVAKTSYTQRETQLRKSVKSDERSTPSAREKNDGWQLSALDLTPCLEYLEQAVLRGGSRSGRRRFTGPVSMSRIPLTIGGKYVVTRLVGKGGMGAVYEAFSADGTRVAVKVMAEELARSKTQVERFAREARTVAGLVTPHVARVLGAGIDAETRLPFIVMEYLDGEDLRLLLRRVERLPPLTAVRIALQACSALVEAHEARVLHRDIKPANLFLARAADRHIVKLLDFGIAKTATPNLREGDSTGSLTHTGDMVGSPQYMSPEQARGSRALDARTDVWSLGVVLYQMLCGRAPHAMSDELGELIVLICTQPPRPLQDRAPWVPREIAAVVHQALRMNPDHRFSSALAFREALAALTPGSDEIVGHELRSVTEDEAGHVAERLSSDVLRDGPAPLSSDGLAGTSISRPSSSSGSGSESSTASGPRRALRVGGAVLSLAAVGGLLFFVTRPLSPATPASVDVPVAGAAPVTVQVAISPIHAEVEVDGEPAAVQNGAVEVTGPSGSVHVVRVSAGGLHTEAEIVIAGQRSLPARVELSLTGGAPDIPRTAPPAATIQPASTRPARPAPPPAVPTASLSTPLLRPTR